MLLRGRMSFFGGKVVCWTDIQKIRTRYGFMDRAVKLPVTRGYDLSARDSKIRKKCCKSPASRGSSRLEATNAGQRLPGRFLV